MKPLITSVVALLLTLPVSAALAEALSAQGHWRTIDDKTGEAKSIVRVFTEGEELKGQIVELLNPPVPNPKCSQCKGERKNKPIAGMVFLWGLRQDGDEWVNGRILDPANGNEYSAKLKVSDNGNQLEVRGYKGFSLLGRTQVWERVNSLPSAVPPD